jgi:SAM-dependent methyltransferase
MVWAGCVQQDKYTSMKTLKKTVKEMRSRFKYFFVNTIPIGAVDFGDLRRLKPVDSAMGYGRGEQSVARYYIDKFIAENSQYIRGHVLEIGDNRYTANYGGDRVEKSDVLHISDSNPRATIVADLTQPITIPDDNFDCIILTQTLQFIYDYKSALHQTYRILRHSGILLATFSGISHISRYDMNRWGDYWRFTSLSVKKLMEDVFGQEHFEIKTWGNVLAAISFLQGLTSRELTEKEMDYKDPDYEVIISVRAVKQR